MCGAAIVLLQVGVLLCCRRVLDTDTTSAAGAWREKLPRDTRPGSLHSTAGGKQEHSKSFQCIENLLTCSTTDKQHINDPSYVHKLVNIWSDQSYFHTSLWSTRLFLRSLSSTVSCRQGSAASRPQTAPWSSGPLLELLLPAAAPLWAAHSHCKTCLWPHLELSTGEAAGIPC